MINHGRVNDFATELLSSSAKDPRPASGIAEPLANVDALYNTVLALKEQVEILTRQRGDIETSAVVVTDLPMVSNVILRAPTNDVQYGLINGGWMPLGYFKPYPAAPTDPKIGQVAYADGTNWDPGSGEGLYLYKSAGWTFIV